MEATVVQSLSAVFGPAISRFALDVVLSHLDRLMVPPFTFSILSVLPFLFLLRWRSIAGVGIIYLELGQVAI